MFSCEIQRNKLEPVSITFQREVGIFSHHENGRITVDKSLCLTYYPKLLSENDEESEVEWLKNSQVKEDNLLDEQFRLQRGFGDLVEWKDGDQTLNDIFTFLSIK